MRCNNHIWVAILAWLLCFQLQTIFPNINPRHFCSIQLFIHFKPGAYTVFAITPITFCNSKNLLNDFNKKIYLKINTRQFTLPELKKDKKIIYNYYDITFYWQEIMLVKMGCLWIVTSVSKPINLVLTLQNSKWLKKVEIITKK